jgi:putative FmdB family regulatory protein
MPTYDYECTRCGHRFEEFQSISDPSLEICPECRGPLKRLIGSGSGLLFKGKGFHTTDYRSRAYRRQAGSEAGTPPADSTPAPSGPKKPDPGSKPGPTGKPDA